MQCLTARYLPQGTSVLVALLALSLTRPCGSSQDTSRSRRDAGRASSCRAPSFWKHEKVLSSLLTDQGRVQELLH